ncbi:hypothetical protein MMC16_003506 [Acarospora aff. strigata]|nr:hypothetical protein [Acarospora aff. strigata]
MEPEASFRLYIPRIRKLGLVIDSPYCPSASIARSTRRLYTVKDNIRYLCGCIANIHCLRELVIATSPALPLWPYTYSRLRKPPTKSDALHVMEPLSSLRNIRHVHFSDDHGRLFDDAADDEMKGIVRLMQSDMPPSAPHAAEVLWEAFKAWTFKFPDYDVVDEIWLARCAREERDLPGLQIAIDKLVEQMAGPMEANSKLQELRSVQQRVQELS